MGNFCQSGPASTTTSAGGKVMSANAPASAGAAGAPMWWWQDGEAWKALASEDSAMLEAKFQEDSKQNFSTKDFTFNKTHGTMYELDFAKMTQLNKDSSKLRNLRRIIWDWKDDSDWKQFAAADAKLLEEKYISAGPKAKFETSFSFSSSTEYVLDFGAMTQTNKSSKKPREIRRKAYPSGEEASWFWWNDKHTWSPFAAEDAALLNSAFGSGVKEYQTKELSFNKTFNSLYIFDFDVMTQINSDSGTSRKIQRRTAGGPKVDGHTKGEDDHYAAVLLAVGEGHKTGGSADPVEFKLDMPEALITAQKSKGPQSLRGQAKTYGSAVGNDEHGRFCFDKMLENETEFCGEWAVFYHSYSAAAILYEVQAAVGSVLFRFKAEFAGLPRILAHGFKHIPNAKRMLEEFPKWADRDHNPAFKAVGLCATSALLADDSEAPATKVFLQGYSVGELGGVLEKLLGSCGVPSGKTKGLATAIIAQAAAHGLDTSAIPGGSKCKSGRSGHMLQVFIRRELVDKYVYPSLPYGVPDKTRDKPLSKYLTEASGIKGQVRITLNPDVFLRARYARMFTFSADPTYHKNRTSFVQKLVELLNPVLGGKDVRLKAAKGIFGGAPPEWWSADDQSDKAHIPLERFKKSSMEIDF